MAQKIVGLDNLKVIKSYIDRVRGEISNELDSSTKNYLDEELSKASEFITKDYEAKYKDLMERIEYVEQFGSEEELRQLQLQLDALVNNTNDMHDALAGLDRELSRLNGDYDNLYEGVTTGKIFSAGQLDEIIKTAMIDHTTITDDGVWTPNVFTQKIVALIGNFGQIKAANIVGGDISGHTISSNNTITGTDEPVWMIGNAGEGWLASKSISWDANGKVTFGTKARMDWDNIDGKPDDLGNLKSGISVFTSTVFKRSNEKPAAPEGGSFDDPRPNDLTWEDGIPSGEEILWASTRRFASDAGILQQEVWSEPAQMTDTADFEVIYSALEEPHDPTSNFYKDADGGIAGWLSNNPDWSDDSVDGTIWMATIKASNGTWGEWQISKIKGERGTDGDSAFKSTVFIRTNEKPDTPSGGSYDDPHPDEEGWSDGIPSGEAILWASTATFCTNEELNIDWSEPAQMTDTADFEVIYSNLESPLEPSNDFYRDPDGGIAGWLANNTNWTDDGGEDSIWMATIKASNGVWGEWKATKIKGEKGDQGEQGIEGISTFKSTVFRRTNTLLTAADTPTGGSYNDPLPNEKEWEDGIPTGQEILWASTATFSTDPALCVGWSEPAQMTDTADFEVIYNINTFKDKQEALNSIPAGFSKVGAGDIDPVWLENASKLGWTDDATVDSVWMATIKASNGVWGTWNASKIKGEDGKDGAPGKDGTGVRVAGRFDTLEELITTFPDGPLSPSDAYVVGSNLYIWTSAGWRDAGKFCGEDGVSKFKSIVFRRTNNLLTAADTPTGGSFENPIPEGGLWLESIPSGEEILWSSSRLFVSDGNHQASWTAPSKMTDTADFEVIYTPYENPNTIPAGFKKNGVDIDSKWLEKANNAGWYDEVTDFISDALYMAISTYSNGTWSAWNVMKIKGESGEDGISTYVYIKYATAVEFDDAGNLTVLELTTDNGDSTEGAKWMGIGNGNDEYEPMPTKSDKIYKWSKIQADPIIVPTKFRSTVFTRLGAGEDISTLVPTGGSYNDPSPTGVSYNGFNVAWSDGVPDGQGSVIWSTTRTFSSDEVFTTDNPAVWPCPKMMIDTPDFETAYGTSACTNPDGSINVAGLPVDLDGRASPPKEDGTGGYTLGWVDEPVPGEKYEYMASASYEKGMWSTWAVYRIKGEKGDRGTGIKFKATLDSIDQLPTSQTTEGEAYVIRWNPLDSNDTSWNHLFVWTGIAVNDNVYDEIDGIYRGWSDAGRFLGEDGKSAYIHIKYAKAIVYDAFGNPIAEQCECTDNGGEVKGPWMGIGNDNNITDPVIDKTDANNYRAENWAKYRWTEFVDPDEVKDLKDQFNATRQELTDLLDDYRNNSQSKEDAEKAIADAKADLEKKIADAKQELSDSIANGETVSTALVSRLETLEHKGVAVDILEEALMKGPNERVMSNAKIAELALLASSDEVEIDGGDLKASAIMAAVGEFASVKAENIVGSTIKGINIRSNGTIDGTEDGDPNWAINDEGAGWLAKKAIEWDAEGNVFLGDNCTIQWESVLGRPNIKDGEAGKDGDSTFKSMVFLRSTNQPTDAPTGGSYTSPKPTSKFEGKEWSDGIPPGIENLWASTRTFSTDSTKQDKTWSVPQLMVDDSDTEFIYTATNHSTAEQAKATLPAGFTKDDDGIIDSNWLTNANRAGGWTDDGDVNSIWMGTIKKSKGVWGEWTIAKIKGEKGDVGPEGPRGPEGPQGSSITVAGEFESLDALRAAFPNGDGTNSYIIDGDLYVWVPGTGWKNVGKFTGKDGESTFRATIFTRSVGTPGQPADVDYGDITAPHPDGWSDGIPEGDGEIWSSTATFSSNPEHQRPWSEPKKMLDDPGFEVIYNTSTTTPFAPSKPFFKDEDGEINGWLGDKASNNKTNAENGWTDDSTGNNSVWMATITKTGGAWGDWTVSKIKGEKGDQVFLHVKYANGLTYDGDGQIIAADWTETNGVKDGETQGPYIGMYSDYHEPDSEVPGDYTWSFIDADKAVTTQLGAHHIYTNLLKGKTVQTTTEASLVLDTEFEQWSADGMSSDPIKSNGDTVGPVWQLRNDGSGHLAKGNIRWTPDGDVTLGSGVTIEWANIEKAVNENVTSPDGGLTEGQVNEKITTKLSQYNITSDSITGKTISSADGGKAWEIGINGDGHFANGNIEWDADGNMTVNSINGTVNIGTGDGNGNVGGPVGIGPWKTYTKEGVTYIGDSDSVSASTNVFASDGTFKLGGGVDEGGIERGDDGKIRLGSQVVFENESGEKVWKLHYNSVEYVYADKQYNISIFNGISTVASSYKDVWFKTSDYKKLKAGEQIIIGSSVIITDCSPEELQHCISQGAAYAAFSANTHSMPITNASANIVITSVANVGISNVIYTHLDVAITKGDLDSWWSTTTIDGDKIETGTLSADVIGAGQLSAEYIDVDTLAINKLNTTGPGTKTTGTIKIENNELNVYNNDANNFREVVRISGEEMSTLPSDYGSNGVTIAGYELAKTFISAAPQGFLASGNVSGYTKIHTFTVVDDGYDYKIESLPSASITVSCERSTGSFKEYEIALAGRYRIIKANSTHQPFMTSYEYVSLFSGSSGQTTYSKTINAGEFAFDASCIDYVGGEYNIKQPGSYDIIFEYDIRWNNSEPKTDISIMTLSAFVNSNIKIVSRKKDKCRCDISAYGFRYIVDDNKYVEFTKDGNFKIKNNHATIYLNDNSIYMGFSGKDGKEIAPRKIVPKTSKFKLANETNKTLTVLTFGEKWDTDNFE